MSVDMQTHPIVLVLIEVIITSIVVGFTAPCSIIIRLGAFLLMALCTWQCISTSMEYIVRSPWASLIGGYAVIFLFHFVDVALLSRWSFRTGGPTNGTGLQARPSSTQRRFAKYEQNSSVVSVDNHGSLWARFVFGLSITCSFRFIGTPYQVINVPRFSNRDPSYVPSRAQFLRQTALIIFLCYLCLDVATSNTGREMNRKCLLIQKIPIFRRLDDISADEMFMRVFAILGAVASLGSVQTGIYSIIAFLSVLLGLAEPQDWPPFDASISEAYALRRLWNSVWNQTHAHTFSSISNFVVHDIFKLPRGTLVGRYARLGIVFAVSAIMHLLIDVTAGISMRNSGTPVFFSTQILGIIIEDVLSAAYHYLFSRDGTRQPSLVEKLIGYAWVVAFLVWSAPVYVYPMLYRINMLVTDSVVPVSLVGLLPQLARYVQDI